MCVNSIYSESGSKRSPKMKKEGQQRVGAVIIAAGSSQRMGGVDKVMALLAGKPVLARVIDVFQRCDSISQFVQQRSSPTSMP